jgi:hypothetical protein
MEHKLKNNWRQRTLENLEGEIWGSPNFDSYLVTRCHELHQIPLEQFTTEDLRLMIGQQLCLEYLVPLALEMLSKDLFAEGDYYEGDLLKNVLEVKEQFWMNNSAYRLRLHKLIEGRLSEIQQRKIDASGFLRIG